MNPTHKTEWITVTPEVADRWLDTKAPNRHINDNLVMEYALTMEAGGWEETHQGLAFDDKGRLVDGQHRLKALTLARRPLRFLVTRGLTSDEVLALDRGRSRDMADSLSIHRGQQVSKHEVAIANRVIHISPYYAAKAGKTVGASWRLATSEVDHFLRTHTAAMMRAREPKNRTHKFGVSSAMLGALIFRAYYHLPTKRLDQFIDVMVTGHYDDRDADSAALLLREHVMSRAEGYRGATLMDHYRMERAIKAFWKGERITRFFPATEETFPLPEEQHKGELKLPAVIQRIEAARSQKSITSAATRKFKKDSL